MSDPVTNAEVEDVLSSIRRLVSEDNRPVQVSKVESKKAVFRHTDPAQPEAGKDRLVLTPALRVTEAPHDVAPSVFGGDSGADIDALVTDDTPLDVFGPRAVLTAEPEPEDADICVFDDVPEEKIFDDPEHDYSTDPYNFDDDADDDGEGLGDDHLAISTSQGRLGDDFEEETTERSQTSDVSQTSETMQSGAGSAPDTGAGKSDKEMPTAAAGPEVSKGKTIGASIGSDKSVALTAKIAALETAIGQITETWEPDDAGESDYAGSEAGTMAWEDEAPDQPIQPTSSDSGDAQSQRAELTQTEPLEVLEAQLGEFFSKSQTVKTAAASVLATAPQESTTDAQDTEAASETSDQDGFEYAPDEQLIDEEALRDLVSEIVRAELQGALGERITRNVRKLVRREIHRALAAQELE